MEKTVIQRLHHAEATRRIYRYKKLWYNPFMKKLKAVLAAADAVLMALFLFFILSLLLQFIYWGSKMPAGINSYYTFLSSLDWLLYYLPHGFITYTGFKAIADIAILIISIDLKKMRPLKKSRLLLMIPLLLPVSLSFVLSYAFRQPFDRFLIIAASLELILSVFNLCFSSLRRLKSIALNTVYIVLNIVHYPFVILVFALAVNPHY